VTRLEFRFLNKNHMRVGEEQVEAGMDGDREELPVGIAVCVPVARARTSSIAEFESAEKLLMSCGSGG